MANDRTLIADLLGPHFPSMKKANSQEWQDFLNGLTGLSIGDDVPNGEAFDKWRQALNADGLPVWGETPEKKTMRQAKLADNIDKENKRRAKAEELLLQLKNAAPGEPI